ncbi:TonB-dependent hemoglobin/transferrin/lactoferrin family receptor [Shewanella marina]|uniref:TonB-dependent hemoglobin/transferrin/lactoferrin family receptor n=1 Tax=Shewanella marina TaxID=487319 RepID=UPI00046E6B8F|nr:TonB-dependent hemoglobin/transferrin/lactoferrin family receptor [Shewanella marina]
MKQARLSLLTLAISSALIAPTLAEQQPEIIVVSGNRMEQKLEQVAGSIVVIDEDAITRNMSNDFGSLFQNESAIGIKGGAGKPTTVTIRGIGGNRVMMVKDGVRVNNQYASPLGPGAEGTGRGLTEVQSLKQVEVVKAAASTMYGSDALGGVVVMRTKDAADYLQGEDHYVAVNAGYTGVNDEATAGFTAANKLGNFENLISYQHRDGEEAQNFSNDLPDSDINQDSILFKSKYHFNEHTNVQLSLDYLSQDLTRTENEYDKKGLLEDQLDTQRGTEVLNGSITLNSNKPTAWHDDLSVVLYFGQTNQDEDRQYYSYDKNQVASFDKSRKYEFEDARLGLNSTFNKYIGSDTYGHSITYGLDLELSEMLRHRSYAELDKKGNWQVSYPFTFADTESQRLGLFFQDDVTLMDGKLNLIAGLRYDSFKNTPDKSTLTAEQDPANFDPMSDNFWSPKFGVIYHLADEVSIYGQYTYGYKMPTPDQKWGELVVREPGMPFDVLIKPNYDLQAEYSHTFEIGVRGNHSDTNYELTAFYSQVKDYIDWQFLGMGVINIPFIGEHTDNLQYGYYNRDNVTLYGFEAQVSQWFGDSFEVWGNLSYTYGTDQNGDYLNTISPFKGTVGANYYTSIAGFETDFATTVRFADKMDRTTDMDIVIDKVCVMGMCLPGDSFNTVYNTPGYAVIDLTMGVNLTDNFTMRAGIYNILDKEYIDYADVASQSKFLLNSLGTPDSNFTQPGRHVAITANYQF